ncbi:methionyl-tRNA formyltransferase [Nonlabens sp. Ci31]|jgi:methionyl-tRNA formyltransferase|uniref:methionyl-tRNA formyltransferase n=1 Tax=Nonlabens sp. Ci31 TaxID=2608253 RepID=UPI0014636075|nr:formyltransferase family protein [Nonlabens sp. Ci31]QJP34906.1 methionyl-tRNA formyltransferase [Nonlabens sp. Ci31]
MKIGYFADGPWSHEAFKKIQADTRFQIEFIVPRYDTKDNTLETFASNHNIPYFKLQNVNDKISLEKIESFSCDILVSMSFNQIFRKDIINLTPNGIINCHAGKLPFYRGRNILNWVLINDEDEFGITVHYVDEGIDTGDIILQKSYSINESDDYSTLLSRSYIECANILYDALILFIDGDVPRINQATIHPLGMYCGRRGMGDEIIDWNQTSREIHNFIRSVCSPGPLATTYSRDTEVKINKSKYYNNAPNYIGKVGQILSKTANGYLVKTKDSYIEIFEVRSDRKLIVGNCLLNK